MKHSSTNELIEPLKPGARQVTAFEDQLPQDSTWAMAEASRFFEGEGAVQKALRKIAAKLRELGVDYAVAGGMALFHFGYRRFTEDVDILVTRDGLKEIHKKLDGFGYLPPFVKSKNLRDTENGVKIALSFPANSQATANRSRWHFQIRPTSRFK